MGEALNPSDPLRGQLRRDASGRIEMPKNILTTVSGARSVYQKYRVDHLPRIALYAMIEGLLQGNPPYNAVELEQAGYGYLANFNSLDGSSLFERSALGYFNLIFEAEYIGTFEIRWPTDSSVSLEDMEDTLSRNFNKVVRSWKPFETHFNTAVAQLCKFGISPIVWPDPKDWRWTTIELSRFFVEDQCSTDMDKITSVAVESTFTVQTLFEIYNEYYGKPETETHWNVEQLGRFLLNRANTFFKSQGQVIDMMELQKRRQNLDLYMDAFFSDGVRLVSMIQQEYDKKFTHMIFDRTFDGGDFLFKYDRQFEDISDFLTLFTASPGEFTVHSNRGVGHKIFSLVQVIMQSDCSIADSIRMAATPLFSSPTTGSRDLEQLNFVPGAPQNIGTMQYQQANFGANITQMVQGSQYFLGKANFNLMNSGDDPSTPDKNQGSIAPVQAKMQSYKEMGPTKNRASHFYSKLDYVMEGMLSKMWYAEEGDLGYEYAKEFKDLCIEDGIPPSFFEIKKSETRKLPRHVNVKATRVAGAGSTLGRIMALEIVTPYAGSFSAKGQREVSRQAVIAAYGPNAVKDFLPPSEAVDAVSNGATIAALENNQMMDGKSPVFSRDNDQKAHVATHMALGNHLMQGVTQQQMDVIQADKAFEVLIPHLAQHIQAVKSNKLLESYFEGIRKPWDQLQEYARMIKIDAEKEIEKQIREQQQNQQATQQVMTDAQRKDFVAQADVKRADVKVQAQNERADKANQTRSTIMQEKAVRDAETKRTKVILDHNAKTENNSVNGNAGNNLQGELETLTGNTPSPSDFETNGQTTP